MRLQRLSLVALALAVGAALAAPIPGADPGPVYRPGVDGVTAPELIPESHVAPEFPPAAFHAGITGHVLVAVVVGSDGKVGGVRVLETNRPRLGFERAAVDAVSQWRFEPATRAGEPVASYRVVRLEFDERLMNRDLAWARLRPMIGLFPANNYRRAEIISEGLPAAVASEFFSTARTGGACRAVNEVNLPPTSGMYDRTQLVPSTSGPVQPTSRD